MSESPTGLCLVEPLAFGFNAATATTNRFQHEVPNLLPEQAAALARAESGGLVAALRAAGIPVCVAEDSTDPPKPDAVFPNNWVSFHADGTVVLYPMRDPVRRAERRESVIDEVKKQLGFVERRRLDLSGEEEHGRFLEGTGSLVLDHRRRIAYACRSPRTTEALVREWARLMDFEPFLFDADADGAPVYHTNVLLWIGDTVAGLGLDWVAPEQRAELVDRLHSSGRALLQFDDAQLHGFAGNMLEVPARGGRYLVMSARAATSLDGAQLALLQDSGCTPLIAPVPVIEDLGGGSVRCMLAEVPLAGAATRA